MLIICAFVGSLYTPLLEVPPKIFSKFLIVLHTCYKTFTYNLSMNYHTLLKLVDLRVLMRSTNLIKEESSFKFCFSCNKCRYFSAHASVLWVKILLTVMLTLNIPNLARQSCLPSWGPRRTPCFFCNFSTVWCGILLKLCFSSFWNYNSVIQTLLVSNILCLFISTEVSQ